jgi:membrane protease YdiL (CAAX protease family)
VYLAGKTVQFSLPVVWTYAAHRERFQFSLPDGQGILLGLAFGVVVSMGMGLGYWLWLKPAGLFAGRVQDEIVGKLTSFGFGTLGPYVALSLFYSLAHSLLEEYYWRWFVFATLHEHLPLWPAVVISSLGFMAHHVVLLGVYFGWKSPATYVFSAGVAIGGAFWAWLLSHSGSLAGPWISHLLIDAAIFAIGYDLLRDALNKTANA